MSAQLDTLTKSLRDLPYTDMLKVADVIRTALGTKSPSLHEMADALATVRPALVDEPKERQQEEEVFTMGIRRKRQIIIQPKPNGWEVSLPGTSAACVSKDLRHALNTLLDQYATLVAMEAE